ncbi:hypothetical protein H072_4039 [Dactylellina haptotyla CBS 200.50]|uniref:Uncharacterized protein n=1 Tax=Dactylellina haptotyla (strain CBS 200.50) TaxID=1284197 RepID=S8AG32_DACHA|nr:hypothetical protein H072_4039 [Dactylellina haptotyla CBS 200.50]
MPFLDIFKKKEHPAVPMTSSSKSDDIAKGGKESDPPSRRSSTLSLSSQGSKHKQKPQSISSDTSETRAPPAYHETQIHPAGPAHPPANMVPAAQNAGMLVGGAGAVITDNSMGAGIVDGLVVGNIAGRQIQQAKNHAYWKDRQQQYLAGDETAAMGPPSRSKRQEKREERRKQRWEKRAARADDGLDPQVHANVWSTSTVAPGDRILIEIDDIYYAWAGQKLDVPFREPSFSECRAPPITLITTTSTRRVTHASSTEPGSSFETFLVDGYAGLRANITLIASDGAFAIKMGKDIPTPNEHYLVGCAMKAPDGIVRPIVTIEALRNTSIQIMPIVNQKIYIVDLPESLRTEQFIDLDTISDRAAIVQLEDVSACVGGNLDLVSEIEVNARVCSENKYS